MEIRVRVLGGCGEGKTELLLALEKFVRSKYKILTSGGMKGLDKDDGKLFESWNARIKKREGDMVQSTPESMNEMGSDFNRDTVNTILASTTKSMPTATEALLAERGKTHGDYTDHARITQILRDNMRHHYTNKHTFVYRESLEMIAHKIGRILAGDPDFRDHWDDIAGYAKLAADRCSK